MAPVPLSTAGPALTPDVLAMADTSELNPAIRKEARDFLRRNRNYLTGLPIDYVRQMLEWRIEGKSMRELHMAIVKEMTDDELADYTRYAVALWDDIKRTVGGVLATGLNYLFGKLLAQFDGEED